VVHKPFQQRICIIGGGAIGSAIALFLTRMAPQEVEVTVVEPDRTYSRASSALSAGSVRQQFSNAINVQMSQFGFEFFTQLQEWLGVNDETVDIGLVESGYLFLASPAGVAQMRDNHAVQRHLNAPVELLDAAGLAIEFAWLNTDGLALGSLGLRGEGWFDGYQLTRAYRKRAIAQGALYLQSRVQALGINAGRVTQAVLANGTTVSADCFVNAAGPWARGVAAMAGIALPVHARRRTVFAVSCPTTLGKTPLVIDTSGVWFRSEGAGFICGTSPAAGMPDPDDLPLDANLCEFDDTVWPAMAHRVPAFEALRVQHAWAGYYEVNPFDHNAIIGAHPALPNLVFANGFSGHGLQHSPAAGLGVAELILHGQYTSLDLSPLGIERILAGRPFLEKNVI
jgi:FAD-dependent oxidoreductase domain-containing protein 1